MLCGLWRFGVFSLASGFLTSFVRSKAGVVAEGPSALDQSSAIQVGPPDFLPPSPNQDRGRQFSLYSRRLSPELAPLVLPMIL